MAQIRDAGPARLPLSRKLRLWRRGFYSRSALLYEFPRDDEREYLSDYAHPVRCWRLNAWQAIYDRKLALRAFLLAMGFRQAETAAYIHGGRVLLDPFTPAARTVRLDGLLERLTGAGAPTRSACSRSGILTIGLRFSRGRCNGSGLPRRFRRITGSTARYARPLTR